MADSNELYVKHYVDNEHENTAASQQELQIISDINLKALRTSLSPTQ